jgi:hypothetical protein
MTAQYGQLLADIRKIAGVQRARERILVLLADVAGMTHLTNKALLPTLVMDTVTIDIQQVNGLAKSAKLLALSEGPWLPVTVRGIWRHDFSSVGIVGLAWTILPVALVA